MFDVDDALGSLRAAPADPPLEGWPAGAPAQDHTRSPAARRVARLAAAEGLFCFHFERRHHLALPDHWIAPGLEDDAEPLTWSGGALAERKYQSFRHDLMIGSFHPGHRGKWTSHELCHTLVGYAWRADAGALFHATAARLAELLPVALYYFFDEVGLTRCPDHAGGGCLYRSHCAACERVAAARDLVPADRDTLADGARYLERELAAVARTLRDGRPRAHRYGSLNLCSDGLRYAQAHAARLDSEAFHRFAALFDGPTSGRVDSLEALEARVVALAKALTVGAPWPSRPNAQRDLWIRQDLAFRLLMVREETEGEAAEALDGLAHALAEGESLEAVRARYADLAEEVVLPEVEAMWAVGYPIGDAPRTATSDLAQLEAGIESATPLTLALLRRDGTDPLARFVEEDDDSRAPLGARFAAWVAKASPGAPADLAAFEAALVTARADAWRDALGDAEGPFELARGAVALSLSRDPIALAEAVAAGSADLPPAGPTGLLVGRDARGEVALVGVDHDVAAKLAAQGGADLPAADATALRDLGLLVPQRWAL